MADNDKVRAPGAAPITSGQTQPGVKSLGTTAANNRADANAQRTDDEGADNKRDTSGDQKMTVRALGTFPKDGNVHDHELTKPGEEFEVERSRAAQLRASGLVEFTSESDAHNAMGGPEAEKRAADAINQRNKMSEIPKNSRGTPLRNPKIEYAHEDDEDEKKRAS